MSVGMGMPASTAQNAAMGHDGPVGRGGGHAHPAVPARPPDEVFFPVAPMLDMAFQLLAFFVLTFKAPCPRPTSTCTCRRRPPPPSSPRGEARPSRSRAVDTDLENDLLVRAEADDLGDLKALKLGDAPLPDLSSLEDRLRRYAGFLGRRPLRVRLVADDRLRYEPAARIIATCSAAGVASVRLAQPARSPPCRAPGRGGRGHESLAATPGDPRFATPFSRGEKVPRRGG